MIVAAADGSALGNPGPAGWCWYVDDDCWAAGGWPYGTNNMGELMAVLQLLKSTATADEQLLIMCDSQYVINAITKWMPGWKRKGWKKADGKPVMNRDLMIELDAAMAGRDVEFQWVKGHAGHAMNEAADERARAAATAYQQGKRPDTGPGFAGVAPVQRIGPAAPVEEAEQTLFDLDDQLSDLEQVIAAEKELLDPAVRTDPSRLAAVLDTAWREIGSSGRLWDRNAILAETATLTETVTDFELLESRELADDLFLIIWRSTTDNGSALRSSIWRRDHGQWRQVFHQGTPEG
ncbi:RNase H family protein [Naumannella halotolerans]|uniref:Ribonuclease H n=1 Tax=Naumannella halotolerans TaxID=993414 RepID=A0A4R7J9J3_9ACTN|nr:RNase H family protein [Naumannella halotolerans]TDT33267.1 ribonuclease HI [Naumannella halotolerans]